MQAALWGLAAGIGLVLGAALGYWLNFPQRIIAGVMAFGSGVLISALSFELMEEAYDKGGFDAAAAGLIAGALVFTLANWAVSKWGAKHRKRSGEHQPSETEHAGSGMGIALGALLDGIPESIAVGLSLLAGHGIGIPIVAAIFLSNVPEGLSSASGMRKSGRSAAYVFGVWSVVALVLAASSYIGYEVFRSFSPDTIAVTLAIAAGAILAMIVDTMIPEAFATAHDFAGLITVSGFLAAFWFSKAGP
jgi:ZIP family zinc transporter